MITTKIDGYTIYDLFISGASNLINKEQELNKINVFPVADSDTGTNLAMTMRSILANAKRDVKVHTALSSISDTAISNAYGNSGMIFAQYLSGFATEAAGKDELTWEEFADLAQKASDYAYEAVADPKEGTILTLMKDWAHSMKQNLCLQDSEKMLEASFQKANQVVENTKYKMKVLLENNVVDAGAKGFYFFLQGILEFVKKGKAPLVQATTILELDLHENNFAQLEVEQNRYCSQFLIETTSSAALLKQELASFGESLVVIGAPPHVHIHLHTDEPAKIMQVLLKKHKLLNQKIEDMKEMNSLQYNRKHSIGLLTDSIADLPKEYMDEHQIHLLPLNLICDSVVYQDKVTMTSDYIYDLIETADKHPTSAQPSSATMETLFRRLISHYDSLVCVFVSSQMSGTYDQAKKIADSISSEGKKITVIDSIQNSSAEGLLVYKAAQLIESGLSHDQVVTALEDIKKDTHIYVAVQDLKNMVRGGRISKRAGYLLSRLNLKPVISIDQDGKGMIYEKAFSQKSATGKILKKFRKDAESRGIESYSIVYASYNEQVDAFLQQLKKISHMEPLYKVPISPIVAINAGDGAFAVSYIKKGV